ncbi:MAG: ATP-binding cassette domain-containing protein [Gammaproteobacteria bacterium]|nr:ATP-binding cassette domain-containing protein [Gammaproteobacteria bacterium]
MLQALDVTFKRSERTLFEGLEFTIHPGQKVGVVGKNGVGKSTLFELVLGNLHAEVGDIIVPGAWQICHLAQDVTPSGRGALDYVLDGDQELRRVEKALADTDPAHAPERAALLHARFADLDGYAAEAKAATILHGLGFSDAEFQQPHEAFSGGWRIRLNLAQCLMTTADLLLLDEPTNHLDLEATLWLESWLKRLKGTLLVIAHDREFLDRATSHTLHIDAAKATLFKGGYSAFERQRAEMLARRHNLYVKQQRDIAHLEKFIKRFRAKASKAKQVQSRLKAIERMPQVARVHLDTPYTFTFEAGKMSHPLISLRDVDLGYADRVVVAGIRQSIIPGARIGVLGPNGAGKSTFLKCLEGTLEPLAGELLRGRHASVGYFAQHQLEELDGQASALRHIQIAREAWREQQVRDYLGTWGFGADLVSRPAASLSGGEKARLVLALIALAKPALLVLDEPTNHLDLDMREALVRALQAYPGALILVAHDRSLLTRTVDDLWLIDGGQLSVYRDDLEAYSASRTVVDNATTPSKPDASKRAKRQAAAERRAALKPLTDQLRQLESEIEKVTPELKAIETRLADPDVYRSTPAAELDETLKIAAKLRHRLQNAEHQWLEVTEQLEGL